MVAWTIVCVYYTKYATRQSRFKTQSIKIMILLYFTSVNYLWSTEISTNWVAGETGCRVGEVGHSSDLDKVEAPDQMWVIETFIVVLEIWVPCVNYVDGVPRSHPRRPRSSKSWIDINTAINSIQQNVDQINNSKIINPILYSVGTLNCDSSSYKSPAFSIGSQINWLRTDDTGL